MSRQKVIFCVISISLQSLFHFGFFFSQSRAKQYPVYREIFDVEHNGPAERRHGRFIKCRLTSAQAGNGRFFWLTTILNISTRDTIGVKHLREKKKTSVGFEPTNPDYINIVHLSPHQIPRDLSSPSLL